MPRALLLSVTTSVVTDQGTTSALFIHLIRVVSTKVLKRPFILCGIVIFEARIKFALGHELWQMDSHTAAALKKLNDDALAALEAVAATCSEINDTFASIGLDSAVSAVQKLNDDALAAQRAFRDELASMSGHAGECHGQRRTHRDTLLKNRVSRCAYPVYARAPCARTVWTAPKHALRAGGRVELPPPPPPARGAAAPSSLVVPVISPVIAGRSRRPSHFSQSPDGDASARMAGSRMAGFGDGWQDCRQTAQIVPPRATWVPRYQ
eukprot:COSAG03_NODE_1000_length_5055_cov_7.643606_3_plen_266_part_00